MSDTCFICEGLLSDGDVLEVRRDRETLKNSSIARGDDKNEYSKTVTLRVIREVSTLAFVDTVLKTADARDDKYGRSIMERINFEYDLVSVEAKYHGECFSNFVLVSGKGDAGRPLDENIEIAMTTPNF
ncbi:hypothetical protein PV326_009641 [Microctonus aethiopoides]|nr:hypothetical protein PV326_009641 [Microctonus aethiopoides]